MNFFADSAFDYIQSHVKRLRDINRSKSRILIMIPSWPPFVTLDLGKRLDSFCIQDGGLELVFKVAKNLASEWKDSVELQELKKRDWVDNQGNLTSYRNSAAVGSNKTGLVVLVGTDKVTDASGLADFHHCDTGTIWVKQLQGSFKSWTESCLTRAHIAYDKETIEHFDEVLNTLSRQGLGDIVPISVLLGELPLEQSGIQNGKAAGKLLLDNLREFGMPKFGGFEFSRRKSLPTYMDNAARFFSYELFLEESAKEKALKAIDAFHQTKITDIDNNQCFSTDQKGPYATDKEFLDNLRKYISEGDQATGENLLECDFINIWDGILKFKKKITKEPKETVKKLSGSPVEVVLAALWQTLREFRREPGLSHSDLIKIEINSEKFKHDYECEYEDHKATSLEQAQEARSHLFKLIGGIDHFFNTRSDSNPLDGYLDLTSAYQGQQVRVESRLINEDITFTYARTAEPTLEFSIKFSAEDSEEPFSRKFAWRLPQIQSFRLAEELITLAYGEITGLQDTWRLPVFHVPYYQELIRAKDDDETRRVLLHCARSDDVQITNMLSHQWMQINDPLLPHLKKLAEKYVGFLDKAQSKGLHSVFLPETPLQNSIWDDLRQAYESAANAFIRDNQNAQGSPLAAMLMRAFMIIDQPPQVDGIGWTTAKYEPSAVVTILHPAVLEMLEGQIKFLFACFNQAAVEELKNSPEKSFPSERWQSYLDLAAIQMPLCGLITDANGVLDTNIRGQELIHKLGVPNSDDSPLSTRLLLRYEGFDDDDLVDSEMFRETRESKLLARLMLDYLEMHPQARDGISLAVYRNEDIQPVIAAIHSYLNSLSSPNDNNHNILNAQRRKLYSIGVTIFTQSDDEVAVSRWIEQWRERWEASESEEKFKPYRFCRFSVAHRIVSGQSEHDQFKKMVSDNLEVDIAILYNFIGAGRQGNEFRPVEHYDVTTRTLRFPILEKTFCSMNDPHHAKQRARIISNRQFRIGTLHAEIMARIKSPNMALGEEHVVIGFGDYTPWQSVINEIHKHAEWVICIDPNIDERLIKLGDGKNTVVREIIGFGSGVGLHGESNYTISTEQFSLSDVSYRLAQSIRNIYPDWQPDTASKVTNSVLRESQKLSGLSLVRATGIGTYVHDFMAYALVRKLLKAEPGSICDHLVTLDAYRHWFDIKDSGERPDLFWITAQIDDNGRFNFKLRLIECKLGMENQDHIEKALQQIENGLRTLISSFTPVSLGNEERDDSRPDQRYWWLQLHRLIASKTEIPYHQQAKVLAALERLADGDYSVSWGAAIMAFWTDSPSKELSIINSIEFTEDGGNVSIDVYTAGHEFVRKLCVDEITPEIIWQNTMSDKEGESSATTDRQGMDNIPDSPGNQIPTEKKEKGLMSSHPEPDVQGQPVPTKEVKIPDRILLGLTERGGRKIYWEFGHKDLNNRHMLVFGTSGMGKTYAIQCLLCELGKFEQNSLVLDYTNGFLPNQLENETKQFLNPCQHYIRKDPLPINPFKKQLQIIADDMDGIEETNVAAAKRIASTFKKLYGTIGDQQYPILMDAIIAGIDQFGEQFTLEQFQDILQSFINDGEHYKTSVQSTLNKLKPFILERPFANDNSGIGWINLFNDKQNRCNIFQFAGMDTHSSQLVIEFVLWDLNAFVRGIGNKNIPKVVALDEAQNLDLTEQSPVAKYLTEGRKFGLSLILATQTMENLKGDKLSRLFQAGHKLFFRPAENEFQEHAKLMQGSVGGSVSGWIAKLADLKKGECYSLGPSLNTVTNRLEQNAFKIKILSLGERGFDV